MVPSPQRTGVCAAGLAALLVLGLLLAWPHSGKAATTTLRASEYELKAAFLFNFARFTEWPAGLLGPADKPFVIGVLGDDPFGPLLDRTVTGKTLFGHAVVVRRVKAPQEAAGCAVLFIASSEKARMTGTLQTVSTRGVLTVGETDRFAEQGGVIGTVVGSDRLGIVINTDAAARAGLRISSKLLTMARLVEDRKGGTR